MVSERTQQIRAALAFVIGAALIDRVFLHLLNITPAALLAAACTRGALSCAWGSITLGDGNGLGVSLIGSSVA
jgi:hypothetical protein